MQLYFSLCLCFFLKKKIIYLRVGCAGVSITSHGLSLVVENGGGSLVGG